MLFYLFHELSQSFSWLSVLNTDLGRALASIGTAFILSLIGGFWFLKNAAYFRSAVREYTPESHQKKNDTPTMGGLFVLGAVFLSALLWCDLSRPEVWIFLGCLLGYGAIGFWDDILKIRYKRGISKGHKLAAQVLVGGVLVVLWYVLLEPPTSLSIPFVPSVYLPLGILLIPWSIYVLIGASNAVNLTDGLDGLAAESLVPNYATWAVVCYFAGTHSDALRLSIPYVQTSEIAFIGAMLLGACLGFLWFNSYPARVFMGDVGSLALGSSLAFMALMARQELLLVITGAVFVAETLSVMLQVAFYRVYKKKLFKMAPIHHHFELMGWPETRIVRQFTVITSLLCILVLTVFR
jgi:phospho-N-acetylmuramoyl-pentapeptide-transferase